ncbi:hypothetical protein ACGFIW_12675 [Micromonospora sp. NPDC048935]|uniref:hypothetical protein n=1 Tax=Micromonospora sp. NPDC048935 TaxID=3364262 RepID=UPI0037156570
MRIISGHSTAWAYRTGTCTDKVASRRCLTRGERNIVRDDDFTCVLCDGRLPVRWNFPSC